MSFRAKFKVVSVTAYEHQGVTVIMKAVIDDGIPENARFHRYTPSGLLEMYVTNPSVIEQLIPGKYFYLDFTEAK